MFVLKFKYPDTKVANKKPIRYPIVGPVKYTRPMPFSGEFEKTGNPNIPSKRYSPTIATPIL